MEDNEEFDFDKWWDSLDDIEREEYNKWCVDNDLE